MPSFQNPAAFLLLLLIPLLYLLRKLKIFTKITFPAVLADWNGVDPEVLLGHPRGFGHRFEVHLVDRIRSVGDYLTEEDLLVRVDGVDHKVQETFRFRFELFLSHLSYLWFGLNYSLRVCSSILIYLLNG